MKCETWIDKSHVKNKRKANALNFCMGVRGCVYFKGLKGLVKYRTSYV